MCGPESPRTRSWERFGFIRTGAGLDEWGPRLREVVAFFEVGDQSRAGRLPSEQVAGDPRRGRAVESQKPPRKPTYFPACSGATETAGMPRYAAKAAAPFWRAKPIATGMNPLSPLPCVDGGSRTTEERTSRPASARV